MSSTSTTSPSASSSRRPSTVHRHRPSTTSTFSIDAPSRITTTRSSLSKEDAYALYYRSVAIFPPTSQSQSSSRVSSLQAEQLSRPPSFTRRYTSPTAYEEDIPHAPTDPSYLNQLRDRSKSVSHFHRPRTQHSSEQDTAYDIPHDPSATFPPVTIDWTLPETRRREYARIDRNRRGLKRLWRKVCPWKEAEAGFHDEDDDDASETRSVRRYRVDAGEEENG